jgi:hypothetical protein
MAHCAIDGDREGLLTKHETAVSRSRLSGLRHPTNDLPNFQLAIAPSLGKYALTSAPALFRLNSHPGDRTMIVLHRLGLVLYWVGYGLAILFAMGSLLLALNSLISGGPISSAWIFGVLSGVSWLWGRAMKYILADTWSDR